METQELTQQATQQLLDWAQRGDSFVSEQAPLVAQEIVTWGIVGHGSLAVALGVAAAFSAGVAAWGFRKMAGGGEDFETGIPAAIIGVFLSGMSIVFCGLNLWEAAQAYFAPRLYIIEYLMNLT